MARLTICINWNENIDLLQEKIRLQIIPRPNCNTEPLTHKQETLVKVQEALRCSPNKGHEAWCWESYKNKQQQLKMLISKAKVMDSFIKGLFPTVCFPVQRIHTYLTRRRMWRIWAFQEVRFKPPTVILPQLTNCD